jgi:hypothetical protein
MQNVAERKSIEVWQIRKIHALKKALCMTDERYREMIYANFCPALSCKDLNYLQAEFLINNLTAIATEKGVWEQFPGKSAYEDLRIRDGMATPGQLRKIEAIWKDVSKNTNFGTRRIALRVWLEKYFMVSAMRFIDSAKAQKIICALEDMQRRKLQGKTTGHITERKGKV